MVFRSFRSGIVIRLIILLILWSCFLYAGVVRYHTFSFIVFGVLALVSFLELLRHISKVHHDVDGMLRSILVNDFSLRFPSRPGGHYGEIRVWSNKLIEKFRQLNVEKEKHSELLKQLLEHIPIGVVCFTNLEKCILINRAARKFLGAESMLDFTQLVRLQPLLGEVISTMESGGSSRIRLSREERHQDITIVRTDYKISEEVYSLVTLENFSPELEKKETESWQHLMRVLNHEIVNSITPIVSLSGSIVAELDRGEGLSQGDIHSGLKAISKRSEGLLRFAEGYRMFTGIRRPEREILDISKLVERVITLFRNVATIHYKPPSAFLYVYADPTQLEQVLINLLKNAIEAISVEPVLDITIESSSGFVILRIRDNGPGMTDEVLGKVFVPYFTTKEGGQGIGLSLCRQLVLQNGGRLFLHSQEGQGTTAILEMPAINREGGVL